MTDNHEVSDEQTKLNLSSMSETELLRTHGAVIDELIRRDVVRTRNNPIGDYTEWLVCRHLGLEQQANSQASFDAVDTGGTRYQIKGRRSDSKRVQFSVVRNLDEHGFEYLIAVAFDRLYDIRFAFRLTHDAVVWLASYREHVNGHVLILSETSACEPGVEDISGILCDAA